MNLGEWQLSWLTPSQVSNQATLTVFYILIHNKNEDDMNEYEYDKNNGKIVIVSLSRDLI